MDTDLLEFIRPALDELSAAEPTLVWRVVKTQRDSVEFEREDKFASIFWDGSARFRWQVVSGENDDTHFGDTLADAVSASGILL